MLMKCKYIYSIMLYINNKMCLINIIKKKVVLYLILICVIDNNTVNHYP